MGFPQFLGHYIPKLGESHWRTLWNQLTYSPLSEPRTHLIIDREYRLLDLLIQRLPGEKRDIAVVYLNPVQDLQEQNAFHLLQTEVLEAVALGKSLQESTSLLCRRVEAIAPDVICTILLVDNQGRVHPLASHSMPEKFSAAINNVPIGPKAGSCGTAAWRGTPVEVTDIEHDPLWEDYKALALPLGLRACWSSPIKSRDGRVIATFALYYREPRGSSPFHQQLVNACVHLCSLAIEHHEADERINQLAFYDPLTQLPNRELLREQARHEFARANRHQQEATLLFLDLDRFKNVNDSLGHQAGDKLLEEIGHRIRMVVRDSDTVSRLGGDEFVILMPDCGPEKALQLVEKVQTSVSQPFQILDCNLMPTASVGIGIFPRDGQDIDELLKNTDSAMYHAKAAGRNTFRFFRPEMNTAANRYLELESALRQALEQETIQVHFQPKIRIADGQLQGVEALARWYDNNGTPISPASFIPMAEESGLITRLDMLVLRLSCRQMMTWRQAGIPVPSIAVNLSPLNFRAGNLADTVASLLAEFNLPAKCLTLELTENLMLHSSERAINTLKRLRELGIALAVDDFGTGFSSLSYLHRFPVNELKLDQSFVQALDHDSDSLALASAIISIGQRLGLTVVAEGVETQAQLDLLRQEQCEFVQGYLFARPMPAADLERWLAER